MTPSETANNALNTTLMAVESLIQHFTEFKHSNPEALKLSDEIARCVGHPRFQKTVNYTPSTVDVPPTGLTPLSEAVIVKTATPEAEHVLRSPSPRCASLEALTPPPPSPPPAAQPAKFKIFVPADDGTDDMETQKLMPKRKKDGATKPMEAFLPVATDNMMASEAQGTLDMAEDRGFWDAESRHSIRHHPRKCDKCTKLNIPCLVLPDKKFGCTRLACANCDSKKTTCVIDGVGVRERSQAQAKTKAAEAAANPVKCSKSRAVSRHLAKIANKQTLKHEDSDAKQPTQMSNTSKLVQLFSQGQQPASDGNPDAEPTARDILKGIQDLSKKFDTLATNERLDGLEARVSSVEEMLGERLRILEQCLNASDAQWKSMSSSVGHLADSLREHKDDAESHGLRLNPPADAPPQHLSAELPGRLQNSIGDEEVNDVGASASAGPIPEAPEASVPPTNSTAPSQVSRAPSVISENLEGAGSVPNSGIASVPADSFWKVSEWMFILSYVILVVRPVTGRDPVYLRLLEESDHGRLSALAPSNELKDQLDTTEKEKTTSLVTELH
ncbi:hypothetical protein F4604DRAFT_1682339 [Suillus subluteus]|nr:hypothetical protein F4604DRAFT_1682339 [Suillus subluteus]